MNKTLLTMISKISITSTLLFAFGCSKEVEVKHAIAEISTVQLTVSTINSGTIEAKKEATLSFGSVGRIAKTYTDVSSVVEKGAVLAELENADLKAIYLDAFNEHERSLALLKDGLISKASLDLMKKNLEIARVNLEKTFMRAPFKGMVTTFDLTVGEFYQTSLNQTSVSANASATPFVKLIDLDKRLVRGDVDEVDLHLIKKDQTVKIKIPAMEKRIFQGKLIQLVPYVSSAKDQDRTSQVLIEIESSELIPVGASADVEIVIQEKQQTLTINSNAVVGKNKDRFVFLIRDGKTMKQPVNVGIHNYEKTEIINGLKAGDQVLLPGDQYEMAADLKVKTIPLEKKEDKKTGSKHALRDGQKPHDKAIN